MLELVEYSGHCFVSIKFKYTASESHICDTQVKDIARSEVAKKSGIAPVQTPAKPAENSSEKWCQEIHSLTSNQTP